MIGIYLYGGISMISVALPRMDMSSQADTEWLDSNASKVHKVYLY